jgi:hypothetical protein
MIAAIAQAKAPPLSSLSVKRVDPANHTMDLKNEIFVCANCGREISYVAHHEKYAAL